MNKVIINIIIILPVSFFLLGNDVNASGKLSRQPFQLISAGNFATKNSSLKARKKRKPDSEETRETVVKLHEDEKEDASKKATPEIIVGGKEIRDLIFERLNNFLKGLSPETDSIGMDRYFDLPVKESFSFEISVSSGICYRVAATGEHGVKKIDLKVITGKNKYVAGKEVGSFVVAEFCSPGKGKVTIEANGEGSGMIGISCFAGKLYGTKGFISLESLLSRLNGLMQKEAEGFSPADTPSATVLKYSEKKSFVIDVDKDYCYRFLSVAGCKKGCSIGLDVLKGSDIIASDKRGEDSAVAELCPSENFKASVEVKLVKTSSGEEALAYIPVKKKAKAKMKIYAAGESGKDFLSSRIIEIARESCKGMSAVSPVFKRKLLANQTAVFEIELAGKTCYNIIAVGEPSVKELKLSIDNPYGQEIERGEGTGSVAILKTSKCPEWDGKYSIKVKLFLGYGNVAVQVFGNM